MNYREKQKYKIHPSHKMGKQHCEILAPCGTARFYGVTNCVNCDAGYAEHPAGFFIDGELFKPCTEAHDEQ